MKDIVSLGSQIDEHANEGYQELSSNLNIPVPETFNMAEYVCDRWAETDEDRVAMIIQTGNGTREYTYGELRDESNAIASYLVENGVGTGDRVGLYAAQRAETIAGHVAAWKIGALSIPLSVLLGEDGVKYRLDDVGASACLVDEATADTVRNVRDDIDSLHTVITVGDVSPTNKETGYQSVVEEYEPTFDMVETDAEDDAMVIYTSGTTGDPKGVVHAHRGLLGILPHFYTVKQNLEIRPEDVSRTIVEWAWIGSLNSAVVPCLYYGIPSVGRIEGKFDPESEFSLIDNYGITMLHAPPTALRMMLQDPSRTSFDLGSVRVIISGGESVDQTLIDRVTELFENAVLHEGYGQTEAPALIGDCTALGVKHREGYMGRAAIGQHIDVLDPDSHNPVSTGEVGEICVDSDHPVHFKRYWNDPEETERTMDEDYLYTDDLAVVDERGYFDYHSRKDHVIISSGYRIAPQEIEATLAKHDAVHNAGVVGVPHEVRNEIPKAFVVLADGFEPSDELRKELQSFVKNSLAKYEYPRELEFISELPQTRSGKIKRRELEML